MNRFAKITLFLLLAGVVIATVIVGAKFRSVGVSNVQGAKGENTATSASKVRCGGWNSINSPSPGAKSNTLNAVAALAVDDVWAAGMSDNNQLGHPLFEHWNGSAWQTVVAPTATFTSAEIDGIAALSSKDVWAVGHGIVPSNQLPRVLIEHWDGASWQTSTGANVTGVANILQSVKAISNNDIWAVGYTVKYGEGADQHQTLTEHWDGSQWQIIPSENPSSTDSSFSSISGVAANDIWAVGEQAASNGSLIEHWDGSAWQVVAGDTTNATSSSLSAVAAVSAHDVWAVGQALPTGDNTRGLILHWDGSVWSTVQKTSPESKMDWLNGVTVASANNIWAVGQFKDYNTRLMRTYAEHWDGHAWSLSQWPVIYGQANSNGSFNLQAVAAIDQQHIWAVGAVTIVNQQPPIGDPQGDAHPQTLTLFNC